jgi:pimeloyl-ACP methyl ester carboxylesterase
VSAYIRTETKTVKVNGVAFAYRELGPKNGIPVVFLHHLTAGLDDWRSLTMSSHSTIVASAGQRAKRQTMCMLWRTTPRRSWTPWD